MSPFKPPTPWVWIGWGPVNILLGTRHGHARQILGKIEKKNWTQFEDLEGTTKTVSGVIKGSFADTSLVERLYNLMRYAGDCHQYSRLPASFGKCFIFKNNK